MKSDSDFSRSDINAIQLAIYILFSIALTPLLLCPLIIAALIISITKNIIAAILISPVITIVGWRYWIRNNQDKPTWKDHIKIYMLIVIALSIMMFIGFHPESHDYLIGVLICIVFFALMKLKESIWETHLKMYIFSSAIPIFIIMFILFRPEFHNHLIGAFICVVFFALWEKYFRYYLIVPEKTNKSSD